MKQTVNIMMLGGAKRVSIARMIIQAGARLGMDVNLFSYELSGQVPIAEVATVIKGLRWRDEGLMAHIRSVVVEHGINILLPFVDPAVEVAIRYSAYDSSVWTPGSDAEMSGRMFNKIAADTLFRNAGFPLPPDPLHDSFDGNIIAKPCFGSASQGIRVITREEYNVLSKTAEAEKYLFQKNFEHRKEYTVDCYVARNGMIVCAVPRLRLAVIGGEVSETVTVHDPEIEELSERILHKLSITGPVTLQFLREVKSDGTMGKAMLMEVNPRLGGGAVCSIHAGANLPAYILNDYAGIPQHANRSWQAGTKICRYMQEVVFHQSCD